MRLLIRLWVTLILILLSASVLSGHAKTSLADSAVLQPALGPSCEYDETLRTWLSVRRAGGRTSQCTPLMLLNRKFQSAWLTRRQVAISIGSTGKERDQETGLDYFGARYFSGAQGRFTSPDEPLVDQNPFEPQSWNLFSYVRNNPLIFTDPTGRCRKGADGKYHDSEDGPCVAPDSTSITVAEKAPKERDHAAEAQAEMLRMQLEAWRRDQQRSKPKDEQPLREAARQTLELAYQRTAHDLGCVALGYGIETAAVVPSMEIVPKRFAPAAAKGGTSIASTILRGGPRGLPIPTPVGTPGTATFTWRSSNTIGGVFGRWLPYVGLGVSVYRMSQCLGWQP